MDRTQNLNYFNQLRTKEPALYKQIEDRAIEKRYLNQGETLENHGVFNEQMRVLISAESIKFYSK